MVASKFPGSERSVQQLSYHSSTRAERVRDFINPVKAYTGKPQVHVIAHSMGVTVAVHAADYGNLWGSVRKLLGISGAVEAHRRVTKDRGIAAAGPSASPAVEPAVGNGLPTDDSRGSESTE